MRLLIPITLAALVVACSPTPPPPPVDAGTPEKICGGIVIDGKCVAKCDPSKCLPGNTCVGNACVLKCTSHDQCTQYTQECRPAKEDGTNADINTCQNVPAKLVGDPCPNGNECDFLCHTSGPGDATAYCTMACAEDLDCPGGYECGVKRDPRRICNTTKGDNQTCGETDLPCISQADIAADETLVEEDYCLQQKVCLKKADCAPCTTDLDCSRSNTKCVEFGAEKRCLPSCSQSSDCDADKECVENFCIPKTGKCGGGGICTPCRYDTDCGANELCYEMHGNEKACQNFRFDLSPANGGPPSCTTDADCPLTPGGRRAWCLDERLPFQVPNTASAYHRCYMPFDPDTSTFSCY